MNKLSNHAHINKLLNGMANARRKDTQEYYEIERKLRKFLDNQQDRIWDYGWREGFWFHKHGWGYSPRGTDAQLEMWHEERLEETFCKDGKGN
tara:strand:+ start:262 stop:540 length:279 start_codon:yes stop_codon:yes gene_type:complete